MKISVIIPSYNRAHTLTRALDSVFSQSSIPNEVIVIDDASSDDSVKLLKGYPQVKFIRLTQNQGVSAARNKGLQAAQNEWIAFLDSDDAWLPEKLAYQIQAINASPEVKFVHTDELWIRNGKRVNPMSKHAKPDGWIYQHSLALCCVSPSSVLLHRSVLDTCGVFDESLPACEDYDLWLRIFSRYPVTLIKQPLVIKYGGHADQLSKMYWGMDRFRVIALGKMLDSDLLNSEDRTKTLEMLQNKCEILAKGAHKRNKPHEAEHYQEIVAQYTQTSTKPCRV